ncbi:MAG: hypothetical protein FD157_4172 [Rhodocyclaceae bacterium]|nr:MAG: hypothetical protein FD157_4172 [Rhodocyclaceae bacterium]
MWLFVSFPNPEGILARWIIQLSVYSFAVIYRPGITNESADALSRIEYSEAETLRLLTRDPDATVSEGFFRPQLHDVAVQYDDSFSTPQAIYLEHKHELRAATRHLAATVGSDTVALPDLNWTMEQALDEDIQYVLAHLGGTAAPDLTERGDDVKRMWSVRHTLSVQPDGLLVHKPTLAPTDTRCVVPLKWRRALTEFAHASRAGAHAGPEITYRRLGQTYWWPDMKTNVKKILVTCAICQRIKSDGVNSTAPMTPIPSKRPFERVHIDLVGPLANSKGYRYILVMVDAFTKWVEAIPLRDKSAETVAWAVLTTWVTRYGWMDRIHSDQGTEFENQVMHGLCDWAGTIKTRTTPYHPQGNGAVERVNRTIREAVTAICEEFGTKWTDALPFALWSMRSAVSRTTGSTPYYLLFGREMRLPFDYLRTDDRGERLYAEYVEELIENLEQIRTTAVKHIERSQERTRLLFDETALLRTFQTGQSVLIRRKVRPSDEAPGEKFWLRWEGPFTVEFQWSPTSYEISDPLSPTRKWTVHVNDMKSFRNANVPAPPTPFPAAKTTTPQPATSSTPRRSARLARQASTEQRGAMKLRSGKKVPGPTNVNSVPAEECDADVLE